MFLDLRLSTIFQAGKDVLHNQKNGLDSIVPKDFDETRDQD